MRRNLRPAVRRVVVGYSLIAAAACSGGGGDATTPLAPTPQSVRITSDTAPIFLGDTAAMTATVTLSNGTPGTTAVTWGSSDTTVISIDVQGRAASLKEGSATITALAGSVSATQSRRVYTSKPTAALKMVGTGLIVTSTPTEIAAGTMVVTRSGNTPAVAVGDVLLGTTGNGYVRRVTTVSGAGTTQTATTVQANFSEAFQEVNAEVSVTPNFAAAIRSEYLRRRGTKDWPQGVTVTPEGVIQFADAVAGFDFTQTVSVGAAQASLRLNGNITVEFTNFDGKLKFKALPPGVKRLRTVASMRFGSTLIATATLTGNIAQLVSFPSVERDLLRAKVGTYCPAAVCFTVNLVLVGYIAPFANITGSITQLINTDYGITAGLDYKDDAWSAISSPFGSGFTATAPTLDVGGSVGVQVGVPPQVEILLLDTAGPTIGLDLNAKAEMGLENNLFSWFYKIDAGVGVALGASVRFIGFPVVSYSTTFPVGSRLTLASNAGPAVNATMSPASINLAVGGQQQITPASVQTKVGNISLPIGAFTCSTSNNTIAAATLGCNVTGVAPGTATVTATSSNSSLVKATVPITVSATVGPLITFTPASFTTTHVFGVSSCPQTMGALAITNASNSTVSWTARGTNAGLVVSSPGGWTVSNAAAGSATSATISFNCAAPTSFTDVITIAVTNAAGVAQTYTIPVTLTVVAPLVTTTPTSFTVTHTVGVSPCPQVIGTLTVANAYATPVSFTASGTAAGLRINGATTWTVASLAANSSTNAQLTFPCSPPTSFVDNITIRPQFVSQPGVTEPVVVRVTLNVVNPLELGSASNVTGELGGSALAELRGTGSKR